MVSIAPQQRVGIDPDVNLVDANLLNEYLQVQIDPENNSVNANIVNERLNVRVDNSLRAYITNSLLDVKIVDDERLITFEHIATLEFEKERQVFTIENNSKRSRLFLSCDPKNKELVWIGGEGEGLPIQPGQERILNVTEDLQIIGYGKKNKGDIIYVSEEVVV